MNANKKQPAVGAAAIPKHLIEPLTSIAADSPIVSRVQGLFMQAARLEEQIELLQERLDPVMGDGVPTPVMDKDDTVCPLDNSLHDLQARLYRQNTLLSAILQRLCI